MSYVKESGNLNRRYYELATLWILRQLLRSGDIHVVNSRRFSHLESYLIPQKEWQSQQAQVITLVGLPHNAEIRLAEREAELLKLIEQVEELLDDKTGDLRQEKDELILTPLEADKRSLELSQLTP